MFYSDDFRLTKNGGIGMIWLAATLGPKSRKGPSKRNILACNVSEVCDQISDPVEPLALRTTAGLLIGVVRVYDNKIEIFHKDVEHLETAVRKAAMDFNVGTVDLDLTGGVGTRIRIDQAIDDAGGFDIGLNVHDWQNFLQNLHGEADVKDDDVSAHEPRHRHVADAKDITLPAARARVSSLSDWRTSPFHDHEKMDLQDEQIGDGFDLGLDIGMDMPEMNRERQLSGSLTGSYGRQAGGVSSSGYGGIQIDVEDLEPLDLGLDTGMEGYDREASITASEQARRDLEVGQEEFRRRQMAQKGNIDYLLREGFRVPSDLALNDLDVNMDADLPPPIGDNVDEGVAGVGRGTKRKRGRVVDRTIEIDDATMQARKSGYGALMDKLRSEQTEKERRKQFDTLASAGLQGPPANLPFNAPSMIEFWADANHRVNRNHAHETDDVEEDRGVEDQRMAHDDFVMCFKNQEGGNVRGVGETRADTMDNEIEYGRRVSGGSQKSPIYPWDKIDMGASDFGDGILGDGFASSNDGTGARFSIGTPQEVKLRMNRRARSSSLLLSNQGSALRGGSAVPTDLGAHFDDQNYEMPVDEIMADFEGTGGGAWMDSQEHLVNLDTNTQKFLSYIKGISGDVFSVGDDLLLDDIAPVSSSNRNVAAQAFYHCLSLATKDIITLAQDEYYGTIRVHLKVKM